MITFGFGLVHGFGFSFALRADAAVRRRAHADVAAVASTSAWSWGSFWCCVLLIPMLELLFRYVVAERMGTIILSALVAHTAWHWMIDRWDVLSQFRFEWPVFNAAFLPVCCIG